MKYLDFGFQSFIIAAVLGLTLFGLIEDGGFGAGLMSSFYAAFFIGCWQMISSLLSIIFRSDYYQLKIRHMIFALAYLVIAAGITMTGLENFPKIVSGILLYTPPVLLAFFYYYITWKWVLEKQPKGKFLHHVGF